MSCKSYWNTRLVLLSFPTSIRKHISLSCAVTGSRYTSFPIWAKRLWSTKIGSCPRSAEATSLNNQIWCCAVRECNDPWSAMGSARQTHRLGATVPAVFSLNPPATASLPGQLEGSHQIVRRTTCGNGSSRKESRVVFLGRGTGETAIPITSGIALAYRPPEVTILPGIPNREGNNDSHLDADVSCSCRERRRRRPGGGRALHRCD